MIKDTGERKQFQTGAVRDIKDGKGRCDLLPLSVIDEWLTHRGRSANIIVDLENFQRTLDTSHLYDVLNAFVCLYYKGDRTVAILDLSIHYEEGAKKYVEWNWTKGIELWSFIDSAARHYLKILAGMVDESHERAFMWNLVGAIWTVQNRPDLCKYLDYGKGYLSIEGNT